MSNADAGLAELEANVDSLIVVLNEKLLEVLGDDVAGRGRLLPTPTTCSKRRGRHCRDHQRIRQRERGL